MLKLAMIPKPALKPSKRWVPIAAGVVSVGLALVAPFTYIPPSQMGTNFVLYEGILFLGIVGITALIYLKGLPDTSAP